LKKLAKIGAGKSLHLSQYSQQTFLGLGELRSIDRKDFAPEGQGAVMLAKAERAQIKL